MSLAILFEPDFLGVSKLPNRFPWEFQGAQVQAQLYQSGPRGSAGTYDLSIKIRPKNGNEVRRVLAPVSQCQTTLLLRRGKGFLVIADPRKILQAWLVSDTGIVKTMPWKFSAKDEVYGYSNYKVIFAMQERAPKNKKKPRDLSVILDLATLKFEALLERDGSPASSIPFVGPHS